MLSESRHPYKYNLAPGEKCIVEAKDIKHIRMETDREYAKAMKVLETNLGLNILFGKVVSDKVFDLFITEKDKLKNATEEDIRILAQKIMTAKKTEQRNLLTWIRKNLWGCGDGLPR